MTQLTPADRIVIAIVSVECVAFLCARLLWRGFVWGHWTLF
jgi:hypothetical protein